MKKFNIRSFFLTALGVGLSVAVGLATSSASACSNIIVTKGASAEGACQIAYSFDSPGCFVRFEIVEASDGSKPAKGGIDVFPKGTPTHRVFGFKSLRQSTHQGVMNDRQVAIAETTWNGYPELRNQNDAFFDYWSLMTAALQGASTAREAVELIGRLVEKFGYADGGESISICDPNEAWILEICGTGSTPESGDKGCVWVAVRIPDGEISAHANSARIGVFPKNDPENCLYSPNVESFAVERGLYDPNSGKPFSFRDAYGNLTPVRVRYGELRVWSVFRRAAPSLELSSDYARNVEGAAPYPLSIRPDKKLTNADLAALMRDYYEGTDFAVFDEKIVGPYAYVAPPRRPNAWSVDGKEYAWNRSISTPENGLSVITRSTAALPDVVGGLVWLGWDDTYTTCYSPIYAASTRVPPSTASGDVAKFDIKVGWWTFNVVSNIAYPRFKEIVPEIQAKQRETEEYFYHVQPGIEKAAAELAKTDEKLAVEFLTDYSIMQTEKTRDIWEELANRLIVKFNDGYTRTEDGEYPNVGYPESWLRRVVEEQGERYRLPDDEK